MTLQEIFDKVAVHLLTQGKQSQGLYDTACKYRGHDGLKCAVGCLIPDDKYRPDMEGYTVYTLVSRFPDVLGFYTGDSELSLLTCLQRIHDNTRVRVLTSGEIRRIWKQRLTDLANDYNLNTGVLGQFND